MEQLNNSETIFILNGTLDEEASGALIEKFKTLIEQNGTIESFEPWGKRRLAYPIDDVLEGYYTLCTFMSGPDFPQEFERILKITDGILRYLTIRK